MPPSLQDKFLQFKYNAETVEAGKAYAKALLQKEAGLPVDPKAPVFGFIGRLEEQKGVDIMLAAIGKIPKSSNAQVGGWLGRVLGGVHGAGCRSGGVQWQGRCVGKVA